MAEFESLFFSTWDDFPWNGPTVSFSILGDVTSTPGDLLSFILLILLALLLLGFSISVLITV